MSINSIIQNLSDFEHLFDNQTQKEFVSALCHVLRQMNTEIEEHLDEIENLQNKVNDLELDAMKKP